MKHAKFLYGWGLSGALFVVFGHMLARTLLAIPTPNYGYCPPTENTACPCFMVNGMPCHSTDSYPICVSGGSTPCNNTWAWPCNGFVNTMADCSGGDDLDNPCSGSFNGCQWP